MKVVSYMPKSGNYGWGEPFEGTVFDSAGGATFGTGGVISGPNGQYFDSGDVLYGSDGSFASKSGDVIQQSVQGKSRMVSEFGSNTWYGSDGKVYFLQGDVLHCSDGRVWFGIQSKNDAERIIAMDF